MGIPEQIWVDLVKGKKEEMINNRATENNWQSERFFLTNHIDILMKYFNIQKIRKVY